MGNSILGGAWLGMMFVLGIALLVMDPMSNDIADIWRVVASLFVFSLIGGVLGWWYQEIIKRLK